MLHLFPDLRDASWGYLNLDLLARDWLAARGGPQINPLLDPATCNEMIAQAHRVRGLDCSYGGWLEDRRNIWRGSYLDQRQTYIHLGVDFNVPAGTWVTASHEAEVLLVDCDVPEEGGWGTRVVLCPHRREVPILIYGHLGPDTLLRAGDAVRPGQKLGWVGAPPDNGGWFPHLHVQCVVEQDVLKTLDGYGHERELERWSRLCPDPLRFV